MLKQIKVLGIALVLGTTLVGCSNTNDDYKLSDLPAEEQLQLFEEAAKEDFDNLSPEEQQKELETLVQPKLKVVKPEILNDNWLREFGESGKSIEDFAADKVNEASARIYQMIEEDGNIFGITQKQVCEIAGQEIFNDIMDYYNNVIKPEMEMQQEYEEEQARREAEPENVYNAMMEYATNEFGTCYIDREGIGHNGSTFYTWIYADPEYRQSIGYIVIDNGYQLVSIDHE